LKPSLGILIRDYPEPSDLAITIPLFPNSKYKFVGADEIDGEIFVFVGCYEACCIILLGADFKLVEEEGEYTGVVVSVSPMPVPNIISIAKDGEMQGRSEEIVLDGVGCGWTGV
jgi:hypothetical protein